MIELNQEQKMILDTVKRIIQEKIKPKAAEIDEKSELPLDTIKIFVEKGLLSPMISKEYGGIDSGFLFFCMILEEIAKVCASSALILISQADGAQPILCCGSQELKERYLPGFVKGKIVSLAVTEPGAGSDVQSMQTRAVRKGSNYISMAKSVLLQTVP